MGGPATLGFVVIALLAIFGLTHFLLMFGVLPL